MGKTIPENPLPLWLFYSQQFFWFVFYLQQCFFIAFKVSLYLQKSFVCCISFICEVISFLFAVLFLFAAYFCFICSVFLFVAVFCLQHFCYLQHNFYLQHNLFLFAAVFYFICSSISFYLQLLFFFCYDGRSRPPYIYNIVSFSLSHFSMLIVLTTPR